MARGKNVIDETFELPMRSNISRTNGEEIPDDLCKRLAEMSYEIYSGKKYAQEKANYDGSLGNFFAIKYDTQNYSYFIN